MSQTIAGQTTVEGCLSSLNSNWQDNLKYGTESVIDLSQSTYTATTAGVITGYFRRNDNTSVGVIGITSDKVSGANVYISTLPTGVSGGGYAPISLLLVKGEELTFALTNINTSASRISFRPLKTN